MLLHPQIVNCLTTYSILSAMKHHSKPLLLVFPFGLLSHYLECIELARHLSVYFKIKFATNNNYNQFVEMNG